MSEPDTLDSLRREIDRIDDAMVTLLAERLGIVRRVITVKGEEGLPALIPDRVEAVVAHVKDRAQAQGLPADLVEQVWRGLIGWTVEYENRHLGILSSRTERSEDPGS